MNFWEAREAALSGKTVQFEHSKNSWSFLINKRDFEYGGMSFSSGHFEAEWRVEREPEKLIFDAVILSDIASDHGTIVLHVRPGWTGKHVKVTIEEIIE